MNLGQVVSGSKLYAIFFTLHRWFSNSTTQTILTHERALETFGGLLVLFSAVRVLVSDFNSSVKFLSFVLLFAIVAGVMWFSIDPPQE